MAVLSLITIGIWLALVAGVRGVLYQRLTGRIAVPPRSARGSPAWWAQLLSTVGLVLAIAAPVGELLGLPAISLLDHPAVRLGGLALAGLGIAGAFACQTYMGPSWLPSVDPSVPTALVTSGPFAVVRNPILVTSAITELGLALMVPNVLNAAMLIAVWTGINIQVRLVEEPYLEHVHGDAYRAYLERTGRFLPGIGRRRVSGRSGSASGHA